MGEYRFNWQESDKTYRHSFKGWLIPTLLADIPDKTDVIDALREATQGWTDVNVTIQINGVEVDPENFFESVERNLDYLTERKAVELVTGDARLNDLTEAAYRFQQDVKQAAKYRLGQLGIEMREDD